MIEFVRLILERNTKIRLMKLKDVSGFIHLKDIKSIEQWCISNQIDVHIQNKRKYVYEHELIEVLEYNYVNDTMKIHPSDFIKRCSDKVSSKTLMKFSGYTPTHLTVKSDPYSYLPKSVQKLLNTI